MRKLDIARRIHQEADITEEGAATLLEWILDLLKTTLQQGDQIAIHEVGKFPRQLPNFKSFQSSL